ncbi:LysR family transcriptional regulator [Pseudomonas sp. S75]|uniref:LysR family transcriptional regulator n=1 Tax=unclassified Pseudomonas TaxID=196821 RepID=UPI001906A0BF|nr:MULTISPECIES: LysR family transcriptional regulator [unclassified Pseudomonas]MBJ9978098.1 LysR family transcriptional regulator [Pseudomonas sp. S30]MBK0155929.1 LysR family transcriptional regulator [Pseudomonas sp. S75]
MIRELKTLIAVAREGTFAAAAQKIGLTQAAVSAQIARLEAELGLDLFDRTGRSAHLTALGYQTLQQAQELIRLYHNLGSPAPEAQAPQLVTLGVIASIQRMLLPSALARFHQQRPNSRTRILPGLSMELLDQVDAGEVDLAVIIHPPFALPTDLKWVPLVSEPYRLLVPEDTPHDDWHDLLASQPFIRYDRASFGGRQVDRFLRKMHFSPHERVELDELEAIVKLVAHGVGIALVPETLGHQAWPPGVRAVDLGQQGFNRDIGLIHHGNRNANEPVMVLAGLLEALAREMGRSGSQS